MPYKDGEGTFQRMRYMVDYICKAVDLIEDKPGNDEAIKAMLLAWRMSAFDLDPKVWLRRIRQIRQKATRSRVASIVYWDFFTAVENDDEDIIQPVPKDDRPGVAEILKIVQEWPVSDKTRDATIMRKLRMLKYPRRIAERRSTQPIYSQTLGRDR
jgi:hypothetical protein